MAGSTEVTGIWCTHSASWATGAWLRAGTADEAQETAERPAPSDTAGGQSLVQELGVHLVPRGLQAHGLRAEAAGEVQESAERPTPNYTVRDQSQVQEFGVRIVPRGLQAHGFELGPLTRHRNQLSAGRGRDGSYLPPPAQIRTCGTTAYGSCLRFVTRSVPPDRDVQFWASVCRCLRDDQSVTTGVGYAGCAA